MAIFFDKMWVALKRAGNVLAFDGSDKSRLAKRVLGWTSVCFPLLVDVVHSSMTSSMTVCGMPDQVSVRRCLRSAVSCIAVL